MNDLKVLLKNIKKLSISMTSKREYILKTLYISPTPLDAKKLKEQIKNTYNIHISLPTLYKNLQLFEDLHVLNSIFIYSKKTKYYYLKDLKSQNFLICIKCAKITSFEDKISDEQIKKIADSKNFTLFNKRALLYGICKECYK